MLRGRCHRRQITAFELKLLDAFPNGRLFLADLGADAQLARRLLPISIEQVQLHQKGLSVAIVRLVPGTYFTVKNAGVEPPMFRPPATGGSSPEGGGVNPELSAFYHGVRLTGAMRILAEGRRTGLCAGIDTLKAC